MGDCSGPMESGRGGQVELRDDVNGCYTSCSRDDELMAVWLALKGTLFIRTTTQSWPTRRLESRKRYMT